MIEKFFVRPLLCVILFSFAFAEVSHAQWYDPEKINKKARNVYSSAYDDAVNGKYKKSLAHLEEALKIEPKFVEAYLSRAGIYADMHNYIASVTDFEKAFQLDS